MRTWDQSKISSYCFCVWCKSRELGSRGSSRFPCVTPVLETFYSDRVVFSILTNINDGALLHKTVNGLNTLTVSAKCSTTVFRKTQVQVHGIRSHRLVYKDVVEARSSYKKSYFWWFGNPPCGDSSGSNWIDKYQDRVSLDLFEARGEKGLCVWCVCGVPLDDWATIGLPPLVRFAFGIQSEVCVRAFLQKQSNVLRLPTVFAKELHRYVWQNSNATLFEKKVSVNVITQENFEPS